MCPKIHYPMARSLNIDNNYFSQIDNEYKAYILGFIFADGSIYDGRTIERPNRQLRLSIYCASYDDYIFNKFLIDNPDSSKTYIIRKDRVNETKMSVVRITNNKLCSDLINLGCNINKSKIGMTFPDLKDEYIYHFIRGFLDGDGSIIHQKIKYNYKRISNQNIKKPAKEFSDKLRIAFTSTDKVFLETISEKLNIASYYMGLQKGRNCYILWVENKVDTLKVLTSLYSNYSIALKRKVSKFKEYYMSISSEATNTFVERSTTT